MTESALANTDEDPLPWWVPIWEFLVHAIVGTTLFLLIAFPAIGLNLLVDQFQTKLTLTPSLIWTLHAVEYLILGSDLFLFAIFIVRSVSRTIRLL